MKVPIAGMAGDQQAALFGQTCFDAGEAKNTYGTGCFLLMNTGDTPCESRNGLVTTIAVGLGAARCSMRWKARCSWAARSFSGCGDELRLFSESRDAEYYAQKVPDNAVSTWCPPSPALARPTGTCMPGGCIVGITRGTRREHIIRAAQESIAYQVADLVRAMEADTGLELSSLKADGGASRTAS